MNLLDFKKSPVANKIKSVISRFSTTPASQSTMSPQAYNQSTRQAWGLNSQSGGKWPGSLSAPGSSVTHDHRSLRQGARVMMSESPQGKAIVERKVDAVAYTGLKLVPTPDSEILGITQEAAAEWARDVAGRHDLYARDKKQHRSETMTFYQSHRLYSLFMGRDNDQFVRFYYDHNPLLQNPLQFEFLDPDQIRNDALTSSNGFASTNDGIVRDTRGREVSYQVWIREQKGNFYQYKQVDIKRKGPKSGRIFMLHGFKPEYAGQGRGFTPLATIIQDLENATDLSSAHIKQAISQSSIFGWITPNGDEDAEEIFTANNDGVGGDTVSQCAVVDEDLNETRVGDVRCTTVPETTFRQPGTLFLQNLAKNQDIKFANPHALSTGYDKFMDSLMTDLSACTGTPLEVVRMKFGNSFSASRATLLLFQRIVEIDRQEEASDYLDPHYEMWMSGEIAAGRITAPGWSDPRLRQAWLKNAWRGTPVPDIDPGKLATAVEKKLVIGTTNVEHESQVNSGLPAEVNIATNNRIYKNYQAPQWSQAGIAEEANESSDNDSDEE